MIVFSRSPTAQSWGKSQQQQTTQHHHHHHQQQQTYLQQQLERGGYTNTSDILFLSLDKGEIHLNSLLKDGFDGGERGGKGGGREEEGEEFEMKWEKKAPAVSGFSVIIPPQVFFLFYPSFFFFGSFSFFPFITISHFISLSFIF